MKRSSKLTPTLGSRLRTAVLCGVFFCHAHIALAQTAASAALYAQLDALLASGEGRIGSLARPPLPPAVLPDPQQAPAVEKSDFFQPKSREQATAERDAKFAQTVQGIHDKNAARLAEFTQAVTQTCGSGPLPKAFVGMSQQAFEGCSPEIRFGGNLTHVVSAQSGSDTARLYAFDNDQTHKVYVFNRVVQLMVARAPRVVEASLLQLGQYPPDITHPHIAALPNKAYFAFGKVLGEDIKAPSGQDLRPLANADQRTNFSVQAPPMLWDTKRQGWKALPASPDCVGKWYLHTLTVLPDARVLVAGGLCDIPRLANEPGIFEPQNRLALWSSAQQTWATGPKLVQPRVHHTASLLPDGSVVLIGGFADPLTVPSLLALDSVEAFVKDDVLPLNSLKTARAKHASTVMPNGAVLVTGGVGRGEDNNSGSRALALVEYWDNVTRQWTPRARMRTPRYAHTATLLADGRVLVAGGINEQEQALNSTELYDPASNIWTAGPWLAEHLQSHTAARLSDGTVMLAGGFSDAPMHRPWLQLWRPGDAIWRAEGVLPAALSGVHTQHVPTIIPDDQGGAVIFAASGVHVYRRPGHSDMVNDLINMRPQWLSNAVSSVVTSAAKPSAAVKANQQGGWFQSIKAAWAESRQTVVLLGYVVLALAVIYLFYRLVRRLTGRYTNATPTFKEMGSSGVFRLLARVGLYGLLLVVAAPALVSLLSLKAQDAADLCHAKPGSCIDSKTGLLERNWSVPDRSRFAKPRIPCPFVGVWEQPFGSVKLQFTLHENGTYQMGGAPTRGIKPDVGHWVVQGKYMLWRSTVVLGRDSDINRIVSNNSNHLELIETNGIHSHFERVGELPQIGCEAGADS